SKDGVDALVVSRPAGVFPTDHRLAVGSGPCGEDRIVTCNGSDILDCTPSARVWREVIWCAPSPTTVLPLVVTIVVLPVAMADPTAVPSQKIVTVAPRSEAH